MFEMGLDKCRRMGTGNEESRHFYPIDRDTRAQANALTLICTGKP
jgi:hypothetical protein